MRNFVFIIFVFFAFSVFCADSLSADTTGIGKLSSGGKIAHWLSAHGVSGELAVLAIAALPIVELRGAIPVAMHLFDMSIPKSYILSVIGNMLPIPFVILLLGPLSRILRKIKVFDRFFTWLFARTEKRSEGIKKYQELGLIIFIAIPLPMTGAWTGALAAFLLGLRFWGSFFCALAGVCIAGVIVTAFSALGWIGAIAAAVILFAVATFSLIKKKPQDKV
jgi:uncharacterized membrane protein